MLKLFTIIIALLTARIFTAPVETLPRGSVTVDINADFPTEVHAITMHIDYDGQMVLPIDLDRGELIPEDAMYYAYEREGGYDIAILCPIDGMNGSGTLMRLSCEVAFNCHSDQEITITVDECYHSPWGGEAELMDVEVESCVITVIEPSANAALAILRGVLGLAPMPTWADADGDGTVTPSDASLVLRMAMQ